MSKYDGEIRAAAQVPSAHEDMLEAFGHLPRTGPDRPDAMAHYLSAEEGWRDARRTLRGTFAKPSRDRTGLTKGSNK